MGERISWVKRHKKELIIAGVGVGVICGTVVLVKNPQLIAKAKDGVKGVVGKVTHEGRDVAKNIPKAESCMPAPKKPVVANNTIDFEKAATQLKGNRLTATELGEKVSRGPREINKRLIKAGLAERSPGGELYATDIGRKFGEGITRTQPWGFDAYVCGWDEKVLDLIFTKEELAAIAQRKEEIARIMAELAAEAV